MTTLTESATHDEVPAASFVEASLGGDADCRHCFTGRPRVCERCAFAAVHNEQRAGVYVERCFVCGGGWQPAGRPS